MENVTELNFNIMADLSVEDFERLKKELENVKNFLPEHLMGPFWSWCNQIRGLKTNQPCSCKSSAKHWGSCVEELRNYVRSKSE
jgi:hypothetical protein